MALGCSQTTKNLSISLLNIQFFLYNENTINVNLKLMKDW